MRGPKHLLCAVFVLTALVCGGEVGMRGYRWYQAQYASGVAAADSNSDYILPDAATYQQLRPLSMFTLRSGEDSQGVLLRTNSFGLRGPELASPKPPGVFRVLCLGDDTTLALDLPEEDTYCVRLQERLQSQTQLNVEVVNAGQPGGCPLTELLLLRHRLLGLQPDLVVVHFDRSDVNDDRVVRPHTFVDASGNPVAAIHPLYRRKGASSLTSLADEFLIVDWARRKAGRIWESEVAAADDDDMLIADWDGGGGAIDVEQTLASLKGLQALAAGIYCELIVTTTGDPLAATRPPRPIGRGRSGEPAGEPSTLETFTHDNGLLYVNAEPYLPSADDRSLSAEGHAAYAAVQAAFIVKNVPGVWTRDGTPEEPQRLPPLGDVARSPRD